MTLFFISDHHFNHANILTFLSPSGERMRKEFHSVEEMNEALIKRHNDVVRPQDHVYFMGDVAMRFNEEVEIILSRMNGRLRLLRGNHDIAETKRYMRWFKEIHATRVFDNIIFSHIPIHPASMGRFMGNAHGHIHTNGGPFDSRYVNLSAEVIDYTPMSLETVKARLATQLYVRPFVNS